MSTEKQKQKEREEATPAAKEKRIKEAFPNGFETMTVKTTDKARYHEKDQEIEVSRATGEAMIKKGWAKEVKD